MVSSRSKSVTNSSEGKLKVNHNAYDVLSTSSASSELEIDDKLDYDYFAGEDCAGYTSGSTAAANSPTTVPDEEEWNEEDVAPLGFDDSALNDNFITSSNVNVPMPRERRLTELEQVFDDERLVDGFLPPSPPGSEADSGSDASEGGFLRPSPIESFHDLETLEVDNVDDIVRAQIRAASRSSAKSPWIVQLNLGTGGARNGAMQSVARRRANDNSPQNSDCGLLNRNGTGHRGANDEYKLVNEVGKALEIGYKPATVEDGVSGAVYLRNSKGGIAGIFKPEELPRTTRSSVSSGLLKRYGSRNQADAAGFAVGEDFDINFGLRKGIKANESAMREVAAYLLDSIYGNFAGVPQTVMVQLHSNVLANMDCSSNDEHHRDAYENFHQRNVQQPIPSSRNAPLRVKSMNAQGFLSSRKSSCFGLSHRFPWGKWKTGSLQEFVKHDSSAEDVGSSLLDQEMIQRIAAFDLRVLNLDRHEGNILLAFEETNGDRESKFGKLQSMVPIDHGLILPDWERIDDDVEFCWMNWSQSKAKCGSSIKEYIGALDADRDVQFLRDSLGSKTDKRGLVTLRIGTMLLKKGVLEYDLSLADLASIVCTDPMLACVGEVPLSGLNVMITNAKNKANFFDEGVNEREFFVELEVEMDLLMSDFGK